MSVLTGLGIGCIGFVFGYLLFYSVKHTKEFSVDLLASAIGAVGGGTVIALLDPTPGWIGPYGVGVFAGFAAYFLLSLILIHQLPTAADRRVMAMRTLLGKPRQE